MAMLTPAQKPRGLARMIFMHFLPDGVILPEEENKAKVRIDSPLSLRERGVSKFYFVYSTFLTLITFFASSVTTAVTLPFLPPRQMSSWNLPCESLSKM